jgi:hypothetical protein
MTYCDGDIYVSFGDDFRALQHGCQRAGHGYVAPELRYRSPCVRCWSQDGARTVEFGDSATGVAGLGFADVVGLVEKG